LRNSIYIRQMRQGPTGIDRRTLSVPTGDYVAGRSAGYENQALVRWFNDRNKGDKSMKFGTQFSYTLPDQI